MDRLNRVLTSGTFALLLGSLVAAPGCHTSEKVPPGKQYPTSGPPGGGLNFNSDPHPNNGVGGMPYGNSVVPGAPGMQGPGGSLTPPGLDGSNPGMGMGSPQPQLGMPAPSAASLGTAPAVGGYNGTVGTATASPYGGAASGH